MQHHHIGSGRRAVIPEDWSDHHRGVVAATHTATIALRRPGGTRGAFDDATGTWPITPFPSYYAGPARVQVLDAGEQERTAGEQEISTLGYAVMLDHAVDGMQLEDLCTVTEVDDNGDPWLVGRALTVKAMETGSLHWERRLLCTDALETQGV